MPIRKKEIKIDGKKIEVDVYDTRLIPGSGKEEEAIESLYREDKIEDEIQKEVKKLDDVAEEYKNRKKDIWFYYKIGEILQFVDREGFRKERGLIWERIADNLRPEIFFGKKTPPRKSKRYPEIMYLLGKQEKEDIPRITWSHWFEILQYPRVYKNRDMLCSLLQECEVKGISSEQLRKRVQEENKNL